MSALLSVYERDITLASGKGARLFDKDGRAYLDFANGIAVTTLGHKEPGAPVNLEADLIAKYVERLLVPTSREGN